MPSPSGKYCQPKFYNCNSLFDNQPTGLKEVEATEDYPDHYECDNISTGQLWDEERKISISEFCGAHCAECPVPSAVEPIVEVDLDRDGDGTMDGFVCTTCLPGFIYNEDTFECELQYCKKVNEIDWAKCDECSQAPTAPRRAALLHDAHQCVDFCDDLESEEAGERFYTDFTHLETPMCGETCEEIISYTEEENLTCQMCDKELNFDSAFGVDFGCSECGYDNDRLTCHCCEEGLELTPLNLTCTSCLAYEYEDLSESESLNDVRGCESCYEHEEHMWCSRCFHGPEELFGEEIERTCFECPMDLVWTDFEEEVGGECGCPLETQYPVFDDTDFDLTACQLCSASTDEPWHAWCTICDYDFDGITECLECDADHWLNEEGECVAVETSCRTKNEDGLCIECNERILPLNVDNDVDYTDRNPEIEET